MRSTTTHSPRQTITAGPLEFEISAESPAALPGQPEIAPRHSATLTHLPTGRRWTSRLAIARVHEIYYRRDASLEALELRDLAKAGGGHRVLLASDPLHAVTFALWFRLSEDELIVDFHPVELYEGRPELFRVTGIDLLPDLMHAQGAEARLLLPLSTGVLCHPEGKPRILDHVMIYGEQERSELAPLIPMAGAFDPGGGLLGLASECAEDAVCRMHTDGHGGGSAGLGAGIRRSWNAPSDPASREFRFRPAMDGDPLLAAAGWLREHVAKRHGLAPLRDRAERSEALRYLLGATWSKVFCAVHHHQGMMLLRNPPENPDPGQLQIYTHFSEIAAGCARLERAGVDKLVTAVTGWGPRGHDGWQPTRLPPDPRLGGEAGFRAMLAEVAALGYHPSVHDNYVDSYADSPDFVAGQCIHGADGQPNVGGWWGGGLMHKLWPWAVPVEEIRRDLLATRGLGVAGMFYLDAMGNFLETNHHPRHRGTRSDHARGLQRLLREARDVFGAAGCEFGLLYVAAESDFVATVHYRTAMPSLRARDWPASRMADEQVPLIQMALHDLVTFGGYHDLTWESIQQAALLGEVPRCDWAERPGPAGMALDDDTTRKIAFQHDLLNKSLGHLRPLRINGWKRLSATREQTRFEDGTEILADFADGTLEVNGDSLTKPDWI